MAEAADFEGGQSCRKGAEGNKLGGRSRARRRRVSSAKPLRRAFQTGGTVFRHDPGADERDAPFHGEKQERNTRAKPFARKSDGAPIDAAARTIDRESAGPIPIRIQLDRALERFDEIGLTPQNQAATSFGRFHGERDKPEAFVPGGEPVFTAAAGLRSAAKPPILPPMSEKQLRDKLAELHRELSDTQRVEAGTRDLLEELLADIQHALERNETADPSGEHPSLSDRAQTLAGELEGSHPAVATAIGRVVDALSNLGI